MHSYFTPTNPHPDRMDIFGEMFNSILKSTQFCVYTLIIPKISGTKRLNFVYIHRIKSLISCIYTESKILICVYTQNRICINIWNFHFMYVYIDKFGFWQMYSYIYLQFLAWILCIYTNQTFTHIFNNSVYIHRIKNFLPEFCRWFDVYTQIKFFNSMYIH